MTEISRQSGPTLTVRDETCASCVYGLATEIGKRPSGEPVLQSICRRHAPPQNYTELDYWCGDYSAQGEPIQGPKPKVDTQRVALLEANISRLIAALAPFASVGAWLGPLHRFGEVGRTARVHVSGPKEDKPRSWPRLPEEEDFRAATRAMVGGQYGW